MKRFFCAVLILILCICSLTVSAQNSMFLKFNVSAADGTEAIISNSGTVNIKFSVIAASSSFGKNFTIEKILNCSTNKNIPISSVNVDASQNIYDLGFFDVPVNFSDSGKKVDFELFWKDESGQHSVKSSIGVSLPDPKVSIKADMESKTVIPGQTISITYSVNNTGNVPINAVTVFDNDINKLTDRDYIFQMKKSSTFLDVGESIEQTVSFTPYDSFKVAPTVTFQYNGTAYEKKNEPFDVICDEQIPSVSIGTDSYSAEVPGDAMTFNYSIKNTTDIVLKNIRVYDGDFDDSQVIYSADSLPVGAELNGTFSKNITKSGFYKYKVLYSYDGASGDKEISAKTLKPIRLPGEVSMSVVSVSPSSMTAPGDLTFNIRIENKSNVPMKDVTISEKNNLAKKSSVSSNIAAASASSTICDKSITAKIPADNTDLSFILSYFMDDEEFALKLDYTVRFEVPLETTVPVFSTPIPESSYEPVKTIDVESGHTNNTFLVVLSSVLLLAIGCAIVILFILRGNFSALAPIPIARRSIAEIFDNSESGILFDVSDDAEDDEDIKIFNKNE